MKNYRSLFYLSVAPLWRVLLILGAMAVVQILAALWLFQGVPIFLHDVLDSRFIRWSGAGALTLVMAVAIRSVGGGRYTLARLPVEYRTQLVWFVVGSILICILCWLVQLGVSLVIAALYHQMAAPELLGNQLLLLTSYRSHYFHALCPMFEWPQWMLTTVLYLLLGVAMGIAAMRGFCGKRLLWPLVFALCTALEGRFGWYLVLDSVLLVVCVKYLMSFPVDWKEESK